MPIAVRMRWAYRAARDHDGCGGPLLRRPIWWRPKMGSRALVVDNHDRSQVPTMVNFSHAQQRSGWRSVAGRPLARR